MLVVNKQYRIRMHSIEQNDERKQFSGMNKGVFRRQSVYLHICLQSIRTLQHYVGLLYRFRARYGWYDGSCQRPINHRTAPENFIIKNHNTQCLIAKNMYKICIRRRYFKYVTLLSVGERCIFFRFCCAQNCLCYHSLIYFR